MKYTNRFDHVDNPNDSNERRHDARARASMGPVILITGESKVCVRFSPVPTALQ
jgi:hypothetical protein